MEALRKSDKYILLIEDELSLAEIVTENLMARGFNISHADTLVKATKYIQEKPPELLIVDVMLPDGNGFDFVQQLRKDRNLVPIIFLTSKSQPKDVVHGFEIGGNDYLKKPFSIAELEVRIKVQLKQLTNDDHSSTTFELGSYTFEYPLGVLKYENQELQLTSREADILHLLAKNRNSFVSRQEILTSFWGDDGYFSGRSLDVFIYKLRKYLKHDNAISIKNVRGFGYKFVF